MVVLGWRRCSRGAGHRVVHETGRFHLTDELVDESGAEKFLAADGEHVSRTRSIHLASCKLCLASSQSKIACATIALPLSLTRISVLLVQQDRASATWTGSG